MRCLRARRYFLMLKGLQPTKNLLSHVTPANLSGLHTRQPNTKLGYDNSYLWVAALTRVLSDLSEQTLTDSLCS